MQLRSLANFSRVAEDIDGTGVNVRAISESIGKTTGASPNSKGELELVRCLTLVQYC